MQPITFESKDYGPYELRGPDAQGRYIGTLPGEEPHQRLSVSVRPPTGDSRAWAVTVNRGETLSVRNKAEVADLFHALLTERQA